MSAFGDGTFKQNIYDEIQWRVKDYDLKPSEAVSELLEICSYMLGSFDYKSEVYQQALKDAKAEILSKLVQEI